MNLPTIISTVHAMVCQNVYTDLDGTLKPHEFPQMGMYYFDGQVFYRKKQDVYNLKEIAERAIQSDEIVAPSHLIYEVALKLMKDIKNERSKT